MANTSRLLRFRRGACILLAAAILAGCGGGGGGGGTPPPTPVTITSQPADRSVVAGATATFSVAASAATGYQWQRSNDGGMTFVNVNAATATSHTTPATVLADDGARYRVVVSGAAGSVNSNSALLSVMPTPVVPSFAAQPSDQTVTAPAAATFTATAAGVPTPTLRWQSSTDGGTTFADIAGATAGSYTTPATAVGDSGKRFRAVASNSAGTVNSNAALLTVNAASTQPIASFTAPATAAALAPVAFDASASSSPVGSALTYSWDFGGGKRGGGRTIAQIFAAGGAYAVTLTVTDAQSRSATLTRSITIGAPPAPPRVQNAQGEIKDLAGNAIAGVTATVVGSNSTATSDAMGKLNLAVGVGVPVAIKLAKAGLADQVVQLQMPATVGADAYFEARMLAREVALTLADAAAGGTLAGKEGAGIVLPANALVDAAGAAVSGSVQIAMTPVDVTKPAAGGFPGRFEGVNANATMTPIMSFGPTEFTLTRGGQPLQLAPGKTATIDMPLYADRRPDGTLLAVGDKLPLWSLDESTGAWINEGEGTLVAAAASPTGLAMRATVSHFSWWNPDIGFDPFGPGPGCQYDTNIGIPGAQAQFATATICNMLAEIDRGLGNASAQGTGRVRAAAAAPPRFPGFARRATVPVGGGVTIPVPANVDVALTATALNGTWAGRTVVNGPVGEQRPIVVLMRPLASGGSEAITLPFDGLRVAQTGVAGNFTFAGTSTRWARITVSRANGSILDGTVRLLQGPTALASANFAVAPAQIVQILPADGTYTIEVTGTANTPGGYRLQVDLVGGTQEEALTVPFDVSRTIPAFTQFRGTIDVTARTTMLFAFQATVVQPMTWRVRAPDGSILYSNTIGVSAFSDVASVTLPVAGRYAIEAGAVNTVPISFRATAEPTSWVSVGPPIQVVSSSYDLVDLIADRNGALVAVFVQTSVVNAQTQYSVALRRWNGTAWTPVADLPNYPFACFPGNGFNVVAAAFDVNNDPVVVYGDTNSTGGDARINIRRFAAGAWQAVGPDNGTLPGRSTFGASCNQPPVVRIGADNAPIVAYRVDNTTLIHKLVANQWVGLVTPAGDVFNSFGGTHDLAFDPAGRIVFAWSGNDNNPPLTVQRLVTSPAAAWETLGLNNGVLPLPGSTVSLFSPRLRFDSAGNPVLGANASVTTSPGVFTGGTAVYRFNGTDWQSSGGYRLSNDSFTNRAADMGFTLYQGDAIMSWVNTRAGVNTLIVQRNTAAGWSAFGAGDGQIPQLYEHGIITSSGWTPRPLAIGGELYMAIVERMPGGSSTAQRIQVLRYAP